MYKFFIGSFLALFVLSQSCAQAITPLAIGSKLPLENTKIKSTTGEWITLGQHVKKQGLLVMFSCNTCPFVIKYQQRTKEIMDFAEKHNIGMVVINSNEATRTEGDSYEDMRLYGVDQRYQSPYVIDPRSAFANQFGASRTPECFLFDHNKTLKYHGGIDDNPNSKEVVQSFLKTAMDQLLNNKPIAQPETKSVGCSIKRS